MSFATDEAATITTATVAVAAAYDAVAASLGTGEQTHLQMISSKAALGGEGFDELDGSESATDSSTHLLSKISIGARLDVYRPRGERYYSGIVIASHEGHVRTIHYDNGEVETIDMAKERFFVLGDEAILSAATSAPGANAADSEPGSRSEELRLQDDDVSIEGLLNLIHYADGPEETQKTIKSSDDQTKMPQENVPSVPRDIFLVGNETDSIAQQGLPFSAASVKPPVNSSTQLPPYRRTVDSSCMSFLNEGSESENDSYGISIEKKSITDKQIDADAAHDPLLSYFAASIEAPTGSTEPAIDEEVFNVLSKPNKTGLASTGHWTKEEHNRFLAAVLQHGKNWKVVAARVQTRTAVQVRSHAQKYVKKMAKIRENAESKEAGAGGKAASDGGSGGSKSAKNGNTGHWTDEEHQRFLEALAKYGKNWKEVTAHVKTRTAVQIRTHAQKYVLRHKRQKLRQQQVLNNTCFY